jgi:two-component system nitrate/nitrite response regulator NarL
MQQQVKNNFSELTPRQRDIFNLIATRGIGNKQIARMLGISESTVKIHVSAIMRNFCVRNRTQLALMRSIVNIQSQ